MNERDPLTEWGNAIERRLFDASVILILLAFVFLLIAPVFSPIIKCFKRRKYVLYKDYEVRSEADMKRIRPLLWIGAIIGWIFFVYCHTIYH